MTTYHCPSCHSENLTQGDYPDTAKCKDCGYEFHERDVLIMNRIIYFSSSSVPGAIAIEHFWNALLAYQETNEKGNCFYYASDNLPTAKTELEAMGFKEVKILGLRDAEEMSPYLLKRRIG